MSRYRKKPIVIEAVQFLDTVDGRMRFSSTSSWLDAATWKQSTDIGAIYRLGDSVVINTLEGSLNVSPNDWIIQGIKGELYPCKNDIFEATYEPTP